MSTLAMLLGLVEQPGLPSSGAVTRHAMSDVDRMPRPVVTPSPPAPPMPAFIGPYRPKMRPSGPKPRVLTEAQRELRRQAQREQRQRRKETFVGPPRPCYDNRKYMAEWRKRRSPEQIERDRAAARRWKERTNYHGSKHAEHVAKPS